MNYWLMKSEPDVFGIDHLKNKKSQTEPWDGVRNYQARNFMRDDMKLGDQIFFYHSNCKVPGIVGTMTVAKESYPDHTALNKKSKYFDAKSSKDNPRWFMVDVKFLRKFPHVVSLQQMREHTCLSGMRLLQKGNRLSIMPVEKKHWDYIMQLADSDS
ncbi:MAG: EVE domain-containing protein [Gammaproteobacteria bacterium]|nr:EVE domain-containing protein [Gammaproteobacteria bacterium]